MAAKDRKEPSGMDVRWLPDDSSLFNRTGVFRAKGHVEMPAKRTL